MRSVTIIGTGLIGASAGLALREAGFGGEIFGVDNNSAELQTALARGAISKSCGPEDALASDLILLAVPVLAIQDWLRRLAPDLSPHQLVTDTGSTKLEICNLASGLSRTTSLRFLPGHPMAGKESGGAALADATLFQNAMWLFTPQLRTAEAITASEPGPHPLETEWRAWVGRFGARTRDLDAAHHDELLAWVSHLPQFVSTALSALLESRFGADEELREQVAAIGARALRETTRLGASPYSMWRDVALTNTEPVAQTLHALEQELAHLRENLRTPELREEFARANRFRSADRARTGG